MKIMWCKFEKLNSDNDSSIPNGKYTTVFLGDCDSDYRCSFKYLVMEREF